jgi:hypothetical protein
MRKLLCSLLLAITVTVPSVAVTSCAAILPVIPTVVSVLTDALVVLGIIDSAVNRYFNQHPDKTDLQNKYVKAYQKALNALNAAQHTLNGVTELDQKKYDEAFSDFKGAYIALLDLLEQEGLMRGNKLTISENEKVELPTPDALTFKVK